MKHWPAVARLLRTTAVGHFASLEEDGSPYAVPLWVDVHGDSEAVLFCVEGSKKDRNVIRDPRVSISITAPGNDFDMGSLRGRVVERVTGEAGMEIVDRIARKYTGKEYFQRTGLVALVIRPTVCHAHDYTDHGDA